MKTTFTELTNDQAGTNQTITRCAWCEVTPGYRDYHDQEWGVPETAEIALFEKLCLESFQSGLSWRTILEKRDNFRRAFHQFEPEQIAEFTEEDIERLMQDTGIVRNRAKISATINNARQLIMMHSKGERLSELLWSFAPAVELSETLKVPEAEPRAKSSESTAMSKALKARGFSWVGPVTCYSLMQATGMVNDHARACFRFDEVARLQAERDNSQISQRCAVSNQIKSRSSEPRAHRSHH